MQPALAMLLAFLIGGIPFGFLAVLLIQQRDVRTLGSGNIGATNAARCFSGIWRWVAFAGIYAFDFAKGYLPLYLWLPEAATWEGPAIGLAAVAGHCFTPYLKFKGGKGVATACGVLCALDPFALVVALVTFFVVLALTRVTALGSMALGFALAIATIAREPSTAFGARAWVTALTIFLAFFLVWTHRSNIRGLLRLRTQRRGNAI